MNEDRGKLLAEDFSARLEEIAAKPFSVELYHELYGLMRLLCDSYCGEGKVFSNFFSQLGWVCDRLGLPKDLAVALQGLRRRAHHSSTTDEATFRCDVRLLESFVAHYSSYSTGFPIASPKRGESRSLPKGKAGDSLRVRVKRVEEGSIFVQPDSEDMDGEVLPVILDVPEQGGNRSYLAAIAHEGSTLNLLSARINDEGALSARWIIYEPDYLVSPSELAGLFEPNAVLPDNFFIKTLLPHESSYYTLLGLASGQFLDDLVFQTDDRKATYAESVNKVFSRYPIEFALCMTDNETAKRFHAEAKVQFSNIKQLVENQLEYAYGFDLDKALLEPSFVCPAVGLAGRLDYLQADGRRLIEQKSGKRDEFRNTHREPHFVQMMLYQLMIEYTMGLPRSECSAYLLYSRYSDGLMIERPYMDLLEQALEMRNCLVAMQERFASGDVATYFEGLQPDNFLQRNISDKLWKQYIRPRIESVLAPFSTTLPPNLRPLPLKLFYRFYAFLAREQWLARMGTGGSGAHGYADLWNNPALVRVENGDMYAALRVLNLDNSEGGDGVDSVTFAINESQRDIPTNFRLGDAVQIYDYDEGEGEPNVVHQFTLRGRVAVLRRDVVRVVLSNPQRNLEVFGGANQLFALEHDRVEAGSAMLVSGLYSLLTAPLSVQERYFLQNLPAEGERGELLGDYGPFGDLVSRAVAAKELFLVIGPPGSGKTSRALRYMVEESLRRNKTPHLLMMAYTNRAVDELCAMLEDIIVSCPDLLDDYLRMGSSLSAAEAFRPRLLRSRVGQQVRNVSDVRRLLNETRVFVGTTTSMMQRMQLLKEMHFDVAFVDEASQILEPYILPFFTAGTIDKFVLVGDQKQLPAVVMQSAREAAVADAALNDVGITSCATSVFDRMLHRLMSLHRCDLYVQIQTQGRMHPQLYGFVNSRFYDCQLYSVPLPHQERDIEQLYRQIPAQASELANQLATHRALFLDCLPADDGVNDKVNSAEAALVAECLVEINALYKANGRCLRAEDVGIIVPYRNQIGMIRTKLEERGLEQLADVSIDTVERYQGSQRDIIIYSFTVRHVSQLAFLTSSTYMEQAADGRAPYPVDRKLNVAMTRAREQMVLIGNAKLLRRNAVFAEMIESVFFMQI